jgi:hypothetical protein
MSIHNVFHVSLFNKYIPDGNHIIYWNVSQVEKESVFQVHLVHTQDQKRKHLWNQSIWTVTVWWTWYGPEDTHRNMRMLSGQNTHIFLNILETLLLLCKYVAPRTMKK